MHVRLIAVGDRQPSWVDAAFSDYSLRLPPQWKFRTDLIAAGQRTRGGNAASAMAAEGQKLLAAIRTGEYAVLLDERGSALSSVELGRQLDTWQSAARDLCFIIGGPDGVSADCASRADYRWSLSRMTLPHGLARVMFAEQLYRAWTLTRGHPYHRE